MFFNLARTLELNVVFFKGFGELECDEEIFLEPTIFKNKQRPHQLLSSCLEQAWKTFIRKC